MVSRSAILQMATPSLLLRGPCVGAAQAGTRCGTTQCSASAWRAPVVGALEARLAPLRRNMSVAAAEGTIRQDTTQSELVQRLKERLMAV